MNMTKRRSRVFPVFLTIVLFATVGCQSMMNAKGKTPTAKRSAAQAGPAPAERGNFPGGCLVVKLDGKQTRETEKENNEQIWTGGEISTAPTLEFDMEEATLGPCRRVSLVIQPIRDGKVIQGDIYQYAGKEKLTPGTSIRLNTFTHITDNTLETDVKALPAGTYRISLQVHGKKHWDRQRIDVTVK